jgi:integrase
MEGIMAKAKKTKSGSYTIRVYAYTDEYSKQHYKRITADTKAECEQLASQFKYSQDRKNPAPIKMTVGDAVDQYIELCKVLSPATVAGYQQIRRNGFKDLMDVKVEDLDEKILQMAINRESMRKGRRGRISPKTVSNEWGLISSALWHISRRKWDVRLPKRPRSFKEYPEPKQIMDIVAGTEIELPCMLALWLSFSMSEIRGLKWTDIKNGIITINRVMVDVDGHPTVKYAAKAEMRKRRHRLPQYIQELLAKTPHTSEYIVPMNQRQINGRLQRMCRKHDIEITFHDLRHLNASVMLQLNIPEKYAMERGGWKTPNVMKSVYQHTFSSERIEVDDKVDRYFENMTQKHDSRPAKPVN